MIPGLLMNLGLQSCNLMFSSMTADICDEDELVTGLRREGAYVAVAGFFNKIMSVVLLVVSGFMPYLVGYKVMALKPTAEQLVGMKWVLIGAQGLFSLVALVFLLFYPITRARSEQTRRQLDEKKKTSTCDDAR
jgi:GPH family glycoside/pentoside/hexuronide:cation symporter